jgi:cell division protease FtsH
VSAHTSELIDKEVRRLLDEAHVRAERILEQNRDLLNRLSALLIATEVIDGDELKAYFEGRKEIPDPATVRPTPRPEPSTDRDRAPAEPIVGAHAVSMPPAPPMPATD